MVTDRQTVQDPVSAGTEALARGAWTEARERFEAALAREESPGERIMYGFSVIHCLAVGRADHDDSAATGTAMRPQTLREYARAAGFRHVEILPIENDFWRFYRLDP